MYEIPVICDCSDIGRVGVIINNAPVSWHSSCHDRVLTIISYNAVSYYQVLSYLNIILSHYLVCTKMMS